ncbi:sialidase family protein [Elusimicrobiota bacterium]
MPVLSESWVATSVMLPGTGGKAGEETAIVSALLVVPGAGVFAGLFNSDKLFKTSDGGESWTNAGQLGSGVRVNSLFLTKDKRILAAVATTQEGYAIAESGDKGASWHKLGVLSTAQEAFVVIETEDKKIYAGFVSGTHGQVYRYTDTDWEDTGLNSAGGGVHSLIQSTDGVIYAGTAQGSLYKLESPWTPGGWNKINLAGVQHVETLFEASGGWIFMGGCTSGADAKIYRSNDGFASWSEYSIAMPTGGNPHGVYKIMQAGNGALYTTTSPSGGDKARIVFKSSDGGVTWVDAGEVSDDAEIGYDIAQGEDGAIYVGTKKGVHKTGTCSGPQEAGFFTWTDDLTADATKIRVIHIEELRTHINFLRADAGLVECSTAAATSPECWAVGSMISTNTTPVRTSHITKLRTALSAVYVQCAQPLPDLPGTTSPWAEPIISANSTVIKAQHFQEVRDYVDNAP